MRLLTLLLELVGLVAVCYVQEKAWRYELGRAQGDYEQAMPKLLSILGLSNGASLLILWMAWPQ